jgi:hypothetical protein
MPRVMHRNCVIVAHFVYPYYCDFRLKRCVKGRHAVRHGADEWVIVCRDCPRYQGFGPCSVASPYWACVLSSSGGMSGCV